jgi:DNA-binding NarL/FixJ family response regulator
MVNDIGNHTHKIKILLVNDVRLMGNIITASLVDETDINIVGCVSTIREALSVVNNVDIDVALVSTRLREGALELTQRITEHAPTTKVVALGLTESKDRVLRFVEAGAAGYILDDDSLSDLIATIRAVDADKALVSPEVAGALIERLADLAQLVADIDSSIPENANLTPREKEVLELIARGMTNQDIAKELVIEVGTVKSHVHNILDKLDVSSRRDATAYLAFIDK